MSLLRKSTNNSLNGIGLVPKPKNLNRPPGIQNQIPKPKIQSQNNTKSQNTKQFVLGWSSTGDESFIMEISCK